MYKKKKKIKKPDSTGNWFQGPPILDLGSIVNVYILLLEILQEKILYNILENFINKKNIACTTCILILYFIDKIIRLPLQWLLVPMQPIIEN